MEEKNGTEKRKCRRFEIPGATVRIRKAGLLGMLLGFSEPLKLVNLSKGGAGFESDILWKINQKILLQFHLPEEPLLYLWGNIRWQATTLGPNKPAMTGVQFLPFGASRQTNPRKALDVLSRLEETYAEEEINRFSSNAPGKEIREIKIDELF
ncbi:MAG: PilZ domain-containing protein [Desulfobacterales bacterium]|nr:PilZ domain-containing protein [Desulfobacterales bacterium]